MLPRPARAASCGRGTARSPAAGWSASSMITAPLRDNLGVARVSIWVAPRATSDAGVGTRLSSYADGRVAASAAASATPRPGSASTEQRQPGLRRARGLRPGQHRDRAPAAPARRPRAARPAGRRGGAAPRATTRLRTVIGPVPDDLAPSYVALKNQIAMEMPTGDLEVEAGRETAAELGRAGPLPGRRPGAPGSPPTPWIVPAGSSAYAVGGGHQRRPRPRRPVGHPRRPRPPRPPARPGGEVRTAARAVDGFPDKTSSTPPTRRPTPTWSPSTRRSASRSRRCTATSRSGSG